MSAPVTPRRSPRLQASGYYTQRICYDDTVRRPRRSPPQPPAPPVQPPPAPVQPLAQPLSPPPTLAQSPPQPLTQPPFQPLALPSPIAPAQPPAPAPAHSKRVRRLFFILLALVLVFFTFYLLTASPPMQEKHMTPDIPTLKLILKEIQELKAIQIEMNKQFNLIRLQQLKM